MADRCSSDVSLKQLKERQSASCFIYGVLVLFKFSRMSCNDKGVSCLGSYGAPFQAGQFGTGGYPAFSDWGAGGRVRSRRDDGVCLTTVRPARGRN